MSEGRFVIYYYEKRVFYHKSRSVRTYSRCVDEATMFNSFKKASKCLKFITEAKRFNVFNLLGPAKVISYEEALIVSVINT